MASRRSPRDTSSARTQVDDSSSVIYDAARDSNWQRVLELCATNPNCAGYQGTDGSTALHLACSQQCSDTAVFETLLRTSPDSILAQESKGMVPLHHACRFNASPEIVRLMLHVAPELGQASVSKRDRKGRTPLYYAERCGAPVDVVSMLRKMYPNGSVVRIDDGSDDDDEPPRQTEVLRETYRNEGAVRMDHGSDGAAPPRPGPVDRVSSFYRSLLENPDATGVSEAKEESRDSEAKEESKWSEGWARGTQQGELPPEIGGFQNHEVLEQFKIMAQHEALLRVKKDTGRDLECDEPKGGNSGGAVLVKKNKLLFKTRLPEAKRITCVGTFPELREPSLPSFRPTPTFFGRTEQMKPEVTSGELVSGDEHVPMQQQVIQCLGCREKLRCKKKAMMVRCPNCSVESPAILTSTEREANNVSDNES